METLLRGKRGGLHAFTIPGTMPAGALPYVPGRSNQPERSLEEGPEEACIPVLQARGFGSGLTTRNCKKKIFLRKTATKTSAATVCDGLPEFSETCMNSSGESRKEATDRKMEVLSAKTKTRIGFRKMFVPCTRLTSSLKSPQKCDDTSLTSWG